jgi:hypothetical protein
VSPYGGEGELSAGTDLATVFRVAFKNTPGEQQLEISVVSHDKERATGDRVSEGIDPITDARNPELSDAETGTG